MNKIKAHVESINKLEEFFIKNSEEIKQFAKKWESRNLNE